MSDFTDKLKVLSQRVKDNLPDTETEEATKQAFILPFISMLGYDIFNTTKEVVPEFTADIGAKKGERVDYVIMMNGKPIILIEAKPAKSDIDKEDPNQLRRYYNVTDAKIAIFTNGVYYRFFSEFASPNNMDSSPFLAFDIRVLPDDKEKIDFLEEYFFKGKFNIEVLLIKAQELKYLKEFKDIFGDQIKKPHDDLVKFFARRVKEGNLSKKQVGLFTDLLKKAITDFINDRINQRLESAKQQEERIEQEIRSQQTVGSSVVTTDEEIEAFHITRALLYQVCTPSRIVLRDSKSYCSVLFDDNNRKPICRFYFNSAQKQIGVFDSEKNMEKIAINDLSDIYAIKDKLLAVVCSYQEPETTETTETTQ
ncbi:MAG: type I restriction endonuclease [bacterium]|nr:type I restriction endonuclease [bacterium]